MRNETIKDPYNMLDQGYLVSDDTVAKMAKDFAQANQQTGQVRGAYLRVLVAYSKDGWASAKRASTEQQLDAVNKAHSRLYAIVLDAVTTPDITPIDGLSKEDRTARTLERNRRSIFARSAKSTLVGYIKSGGRLGNLDPTTVTKEWLRKETTPPEPAHPADRAESLEVKLAAAVKEMAELDREDAKIFIDELHTSLLRLVATPLTRRQMRRGEVTLTPDPHH